MYNKYDYLPPIAVITSLIGVVLIIARNIICTETTTFCSNSHLWIDAFSIFLSCVAIICIIIWCIYKCCPPKSCVEGNAYVQFDH